MPPPSNADNSGPAEQGTRDLIEALKPDQEKLASLTKQLHQMENPSLMDKLKAVRHGGMENALENMRDQIAEVQKSMADKLSPGGSPQPGGPMDPIKAMQSQVEKLQQQLTIDQELKKNGLPGLLTDGQSEDAQKLIQKNLKQIDALSQEKQEAEKLGHGEGTGHKASVRESMSRGAGSQQHGHGVGPPKPSAGHSY